VRWGQAFDQLGGSNAQQSFGKMRTIRQRFRQFCRQNGIDKTQGAQSGQRQMGCKAPISPIKTNESLFFPHGLFQGPTLVDDMGHQTHRRKACRVRIDKREWGLRGRVRSGWEGSDGMAQAPARPTGLGQVLSQKQR
jgi:hypothetical protein